jgi:hypothetical protein
MSGFLISHTAVLPPRGELAETVIDYQVAGVAWELIKADAAAFMEKEGHTSSSEILQQKFELANTRASLARSSLETRLHQDHYNASSWCRTPHLTRGPVEMAVSGGSRIFSEVWVDLPQSSESWKSPVYTVVVTSVRAPGHTVHLTTLFIALLTMAGTLPPSTGCLLMCLYAAWIYYIQSTRSWTPDNALTDDSVSHLLDKLRDDEKKCDE